jgi:hypothetical protein
MKNRQNMQYDFLLEKFLKCEQNAECITKLLKIYRDFIPFGFTLSEIGMVLGITRERVRQIESSAIKKLKHPKIGRKLRNYLNIV